MTMQQRLTIHAAMARRNREALEAWRKEGKHD